jgi:hypothetical protein
MKKFIGSIILVFSFLLPQFIQAHQSVETEQHTHK